MKMRTLILASGLVLIHGAAFSQQQFDSLGSPTPAPAQTSSPNATGPNVPLPADKNVTSGKPATDGSGVSTMGIPASPNQPAPSKPGMSNPDPTGVNGTTPSGLTPD